jgi:tricorn protease
MARRGRTSSVANAAPMDSRGYYRTPTIAGERIVFVCEDDLWSVDAGGGLARRLTAGPGVASLPRLSPDGSTVAYAGRDEGGPEVYTIPAEGGPPRRITFLGSDALYVSGWSRDGREIYFTSDAGVPFVKETVAFAVGRDGGEPRRLPVGHAMSIDVAANGATLLGRNNLDPARWKRYRGGTAGHLWVDAGGSGEFVRIGRALDGNLVWPMWHGERVVFLSDHEGMGNLYSARADGSDLQRLTDERTYFARYPAGDGTRIVYACGGEIVLLDPQAASAVRVPIEAPSAAPQTARRFVDAADLLESFVPSPDGKALAFVSRGHAYAMPLWEAAVSEFGVGTGGRRRAIVWLHDGTRVAFVDDSAGFERIAIEPVDQSAPPAYATTADVGRITELVASPCGDRLAFANHRHELFVLDLGGEPRKLDTSKAWRCIDLAFSPDGRWLAYVWWPKSSTSIVRIADTESETLIDATAPLREDRAPAWDPEGKYLYFISARDFNPIYDALQFDLSFPHAMRPYVATLRRDVPNPFVAVPAPLHRAKDDDDDEDDDDGDDGKAKKKPAPISIDGEGLAQRILAFPVEEGHYERIAGVKGRAVFSHFPVRGIKPARRDEDEGGTLLAYDFAGQRSATLAGEIDDFVLGNDARTLVYESREKLRAIDAGGELPDEEPEEKPATEMNRRTGWLDLGRAGVLVEPHAEWTQMLREAWRLQREQFWDPQMSGVDWDAVLARYEALLPRIRTRAELSDLIWDMQGELGTSHAYEMGGDLREPPQYRRGFLGADYRWDPARAGYRITAILRGDSWNRSDDSPLAEPGVDAREGDAIVAVGGVRVSPTRTPDELLVNLAGRDVALDINRGGTAHRVLVRALRDERALRYRAWVDANRRLVHERTGGRVGYLHIPDMGPWGFAEFHRGYLSEFERDGLIVDVRYNRGGHVSPLLLEKLARKRVGYDVSRYGPPQPYPPESVGGPLVALTNQFAGSDGDIFSHCFKLYGLGTLIGMRTWGGVIGIHPYHELVDGTTTTQPEYSFWFVDAGWQVENYGTDPDVEVDIAPQDSAAGADPQMEKALEIIAATLDRVPRQPAFPPYPNRGYRPGPI